MNSPIPHLISVDIRINESGWFVATSADCPGLFIAYPDRRTVEDSIGDAIELLYLAKFHQEVKAVRLSRPSEGQTRDQDHLPFAAIPADRTATQQSA